MSVYPLDRVVAIVLAGGAGSRLWPFSDYFPKPMVPFGGRWVAVDFVLSNCRNSDIHEVHLATQFLANPLIRYIRRAWPLNDLFNVELAQAQQEPGIVGTAGWYSGTADAARRILPGLSPRVQDVLVLPADHITVVDYRQVLAAKAEKEAGFMICALAVPVAEARGSLGVLEISLDGEVIGFKEKPLEPAQIAGRPGYCWASAGMYVAGRAFLQAKLFEASLLGDFGKEFIPWLLQQQGARVFAYDLARNQIPGQEAFAWADIGTWPAFMEAHLDVASRNPKLNLRNKHWPIQARHRPMPPTEVVDSRENQGLFRQVLLNSGCYIDNSDLDQVVLGRSVEAYESSLSRVVVGDGVIIRPGCNIRNAVLLGRGDDDRIIPERSQIGVSVADDRARGLHVVEGEQGEFITVVSPTFAAF